MSNKEWTTRQVQKPVRVKTLVHIFIVFSRRVDRYDWSAESINRKLDCGSNLFCITFSVAPSGPILLFQTRWCQVLVYPGWYRHHCRPVSLSSGGGISAPIFPGGLPSLWSPRFGLIFRRGCRQYDCSKRCLILEESNQLQLTTPYDIFKSQSDQLTTWL